MNKEEYLRKLSFLIKDLPEEDKEDIISDYEEHFLIGMEKGRDEAEISRSLGDPRTVAKQIKAEYMIKKAEDTPSASGMIEAALAAAGLGIFNLIFIVGPGILLVAIILGLILTGLVVTFAGITTIMAPLLQPIFPNYIHLAGNEIIDKLIIILGGIGLTVGGIVLVVVMVYISKWLYNLAIRYLKLNLRIIKGRT